MQRNIKLPKGGLLTPSFFTDADLQNLMGTRKWSIWKIKQSCLGDDS